MTKDFNVGVKAIIKIDGKCLLLKSEQGYWDLPGGRINDDETILHALKRELHEELPSMDTYTIGQIVHAHRLTKDLPDSKGLLLLFYLVDAAPFEINLSDEHVGHCWVDEKSVNNIATLESGYKEAILKIV